MISDDLVCVNSRSLENHRRLGYFDTYRGDHRHYSHRFCASFYRPYAVVCLSVCLCGSFYRVYVAFRCVVSHRMERYAYSDSPSTHDTFVVIYRRNFRPGDAGIDDHDMVCDYNVPVVDRGDTPHDDYYHHDDIPHDHASFRFDDNNRPLMKIYNIKITT